jgi:hypothetical protein
MRAMRDICRGTIGLPSRATALAGLVQVRARRTRAGVVRV